MGEVGLEILKDIPGFQAILKTLVKSQMQHLINQLSDHGDAETIILSVNRCDGTIHQLGSRKGEEFLGYRHDLKSQFLQYCLQPYHPDENTGTDVDTVEADYEADSLDSGVTETVLTDDGNSPAVLPDQMSSPLVVNNKPEKHTTMIKNRRKFSSQHKETRNHNIVNTSGKSMFEAHSVRTDGIKADLAHVKSEPVNTENHGDVDCLNNSESFADNGTPSPSAAEMDVDFDKSELINNMYAGYNVTGTSPTSMLIRQIHTKVKQTFKCQKCGKTFKNAQNLKVHDRKHSGIRPFSCEFCHQQFYQRSHLRCHVRTHTGEKPYECEICGQRFTQSSSMHSHYRLLHFPKLQPL